jgi:hypothetical protein
METLLPEEDKTPLTYADIYASVVNPDKTNIK